MAMQTDVKSKNVTATGASGVGGRVRLKAVYFVPGGTAGSISFRDGGATGTELLKIDAVASATQAQTVLIPGEGILFSSDPYVTLSVVTSVTFFYG